MTNIQASGDNPSIGLQNRFHLSEPKQIQRFVLAKDLHGFKLFKGWLVLLIRRIIHLVKYRVLITDSRILHFSKTFRSLTDRNISTLVQKKQKQNEGLLNGIARKIKAYVTLFQHTDLANRAATTMLKPSTKSFHSLFTKAQKEMTLTHEQVIHMQHRWEEHAQLGYCDNAVVRKKLTASILNGTMCHPESVKRNFALMHAESILQKDPLLKQFQGGETSLTGTYFLHFAKKNASTSAIKNIVEHLEAELENFQKVSFDYITAVNQAKQEKQLLDKEVKDAIHNIKTLKPKGHHMVLTKWFFKQGSPHVLAYIVSKHETGNYAFTVVNTGAGSEKYHKTISKEGKLYISPYYTITNIPPQNICQEQFWESLLKLKNNLAQLDETRTFYEQTLNFVGGKHLDYPIPIEEQITPQRAGSCAWKIFPALMRRLIHPIEYKKLIYRMKIQSIIHFFKLFRKQLPSDPIARHLLKKSVASHYTRDKKLLPYGIDNILSPAEKKQLKLIIDYLQKQNEP